LIVHVCVFTFVCYVFVCFDYTFGLRSLRFTLRFVVLLPHVGLPHCTVHVLRFTLGYGLRIPHVYGYTVTFTGSRLVAPYHVLPRYGPRCVLVYAHVVTFYARFWVPVTLFAVTFDYTFTRYFFFFSFMINGYDCY